MNRYESNLKATSPAISEIKNAFSKMPKGVHDLTHRKVFDASEGWIIPFDYHEMVPFSTLYLTYDIQLLSHNPTFRRLLSGASIEVRVYKRNKNDSWMHWNNFITRGRDGKDNSSIPYLLFTSASSNDYYRTTLCPHSPSSYLGLLPPLFFGWTENNVSDPSDFVKSSYPQHILLTKKNSSAFDGSILSTGLTRLSSIPNNDSLPSALKISALPFVMLEAINKEFVNWNLLQNNTHLIKPNENFQDILPFEITGGGVNTSDYDLPYLGNTASLSDYNNSTSYPVLNVLRRADKRGDYFDTGSPFPDLLRGDVPTLDVIGASISADLDFSNVVGHTDNIGIQTALGISHNSDNQPSLALIDINSSTHARSWHGSDSQIVDALNRGVLSNAIVNGISFSMNQWRALATLTVFRERMARTDGSYNEMIEAQFGMNPHVHTHRPIFCGGFRQPIVFSEVVQQSASGDTPLGTTAGRSVSAQQNKTIEVSTDDYCDVMAVMVIRSDEYYNQGVDKRVSRLTQAEQYFPIMNNLAPDATKNKELYISGNNDTDEDVFNYQERFAYYKSNQNKVTGLMGLPYSSGAGSITQYIKHRTFTSTPNFNPAFMQDSEDSNMKSVYTSSVESEYVLSVACTEKLIAPIPEVTVPSDMGISY